VATDKTFELKVGLFVGIGIILFFIIVFSIGDVTLVKRGYRVHTVFSFIDGITESAPVRFAGVDIGHVEGIKLFVDEEARRTKVKVTVWVNSEDRKIEKDAIATINTLGLLGEKYLEIFPGSIDAGMLKNGESLAGQDPVMMRDVTNTLTELAKSAKVVVERLKKGEGTIGKLLTEEKIYNDLEDFVADIKAHPWKLLSKPRGTKRTRKKEGDR